MNFRRRAVNNLMFFFLFLTGALVLTSCGGGSSTTTTTTTTTPAANNSVDLTVGFGPNGQAGGYINGVFTTVTICQAGTSTCTDVPNVLVDTGSVGLRVLSSAISSLTLSAIKDTSGDALQECIQYGDTSFSWGPVLLADVKLGGETAASLPIQSIGGNTFAVPSSNCLTMPVNPALPNNGNEDTVAALGSNGILGIGDGIWDCGTGCANVSTGSTYSGYPYYICPSGSCEEIGVPTSDQAANPVAAFSSSDKNGVIITLPAVPSNGTTSVTGTLTFGIATQSNNALGSQTIFGVDACGDLPTVTYNSQQYTDTACTSNTGTGGLGAIFDTGSNALYVLDATTLSPLGISDCTATGYYCVTGGGTATISNIALLGYNSVGSGTVSVNIGDATTLLNANPTFAAYNNLGSDSGSGPSTDFFDFGLPFFLGKTIYISIGGQTVSGVSNAPNGFVAF